MNKWLLMASLAAVSFTAQATAHSITVYQDPNCGCCTGWVEHMREAGFEVNAIKSTSMAMIKHKLGVPMELASCHTAILEETGQLVEGHVPANVVHKMIADSSVRGVAAPGMPANSPGMGELDGNLITVDFDGQFFSRD